MAFSSQNRTSLIKQATNSTFDLLIIGGGITGAGISLDATARGLKVILVDMQDFSAGTSSRSTKLIHGGLRYLKQLEFKLVAEVGKEREIIHKIAPHLTLPAPMIMPILENGSLNIFTTKIGMWIYEWLAGVKKEERHKLFNIENSLKAEPLLRKNDLKGSVLFYEYGTDDSRLTIEVLKEAENRGALEINYMKATSFIYNDNKITGAIVEDQITGKSQEIKANYVVNASGPWVDELDSFEKTAIKNKLHITKGVHLVVDWKKLPVKQALYFDTEDKRMLFVIPREGKTYFGTTDTFYKGDMINPEITVEDRDYLLNGINSYFTGITLHKSDIESAWSGLRPLVNKPGKGPSEISRKDEMFVSESGLLTIAGGKLTGYRKMAQRIVDKISEKIYLQKNIKVPACSTQIIPLSGGKINNAPDFFQFKKNQTQQGIILGLTEEEINTMLHYYGSNITELYTIISELKNEKNELPLLLRAQLVYSIRHEMCVNPSDFFIRRTALFSFNIEFVKKWKSLLTTYMQTIMLWDAPLKNKYEQDLQTKLDAIETLRTI